MHDSANVRTDSGQCPHSDIDINFHLTTMVDSNVGSMHIWATCKICEKKMNFGRGLAMGASSRFPTRDSEPDKCGILIPMIAEGDEASREWGLCAIRPETRCGRKLMARALNTFGAKE
jgi:hypothetical protein